MNRKLKLALAALLGFSTACSSVKNAPKKGAENQQTEADSLKGRDSLRHRIIVMYGVRPPAGMRDKVQQGSQIDPVAERPEADSIPASEGQKAPGTAKSSDK